MDPSRFPGAENLVAVRVRGRSVSGGARGVVVGCVLELVKKDRSSELREFTFSESEALNLASFEAFIRALNRYLAVRRNQP